MSIVPYNTNHQILFHDPNEGILIVRNSKQNTVQLVSTAVSTSDASSNRNQPNEQFNSNRFPNNGPSNTHKCPNCGFTWPEYSPASGHRNPSDSSSNMTTIDPSESVALAKTFPKGFMHHDYFKFLGKLEYNESTSSSIPYHSLPADIFNQGYFKRFFKKVPPFTLGSGAHAQVYKVIHVLNEIKLGTYAVKRISIGNQFEMLEQVLNEVLILYELSVKGANENNLIRYNHVWLELGDIDDSSTFCLPDGDNIPKDIKTQVPYVFILQQYCGGGHLEDLVVGNFQKENQYSWKDKIELERQKRRASRGKAVPIEENKRKWLTELEIWKFFTDVANGVNYLHLHGILHRDLKPSNCLLDVKFKIAEEPQVFFDTVGECDDELEKLPKVLVSDFGEGQIIDKRNILETNISEIRNESANERRGNTGTLEFTAPELWLFSNYDPALGDENKKFINDFSYESDIYSLGLILCYLCCGKLPFSDLLNGELDPQNIKNKIIEWYFDLTPESFHVWFSNSAKFEDDGFDSPSTCFYDFENLIYSMIKGDENDGDKGTSSRATSTEVIGVLQTMRWERFIKERESRGRQNSVGSYTLVHTRSQGSVGMGEGTSLNRSIETRTSDETVDANSESDGYDDDDDDDEVEESDEENFLNLTSIAQSESLEDENGVPLIKDVGKGGSVVKLIPHHNSDRYFAAIPSYVLLLLALEYSPISSGSNYIIAAKLTTLTFMVLDNFLPRSRTSQIRLVFICLAIVVAILLLDTLYNT